MPYVSLIGAGHFVQAIQEIVWHIHTVSLKYYQQSEVIELSLREPILTGNVLDD